MITLTETATKQIKSMLEEKGNGRALRISVETGGCSGMQYGMAFDDQQDNDEVVRQDGVAVVLDPMSANLLKGSVIDYIDSLQGSGFQIKNPNAQSSCGCGRSFC